MAQYDYIVIAAAFLLPILQRPNLTTTTGASVTRLLFAGTRAIGVEYLRDGTVPNKRFNPSGYSCLLIIES